VTARKSLTTLRRLRERQRDATRASLTAANRELAAFEAKRRGWRAALDREAERDPGEPFGATGLWLEAARTREWRGTAEAERLRGRVIEAERAHRAADLAVEQVLHLLREAAKKEERARRMLDQKRLDDFKTRAEEAPLPTEPGRSDDG
jgi:hypothetical protein